MLRTGIRIGKSIEKNKNAYNVRIFKWSANRIERVRNRSLRHLWPSRQRRKGETIKEVRTIGYKLFIIMNLSLGSSKFDCGRENKLRNRETENKVRCWK